MDWGSGGWRFWTWRAWDCVEIDEGEEARRGVRRVLRGGLVLLFVSTPIPNSRSQV